MIYQQNEKYDNKLCPLECRKYLLNENISTDAPFSCLLPQYNVKHSECILSALIWCINSSSLSDKNSLQRYFCSKMYLNLVTSRQERAL